MATVLFAESVYTVYFIIYKPERVVR